MGIDTFAHICLTNAHRVIQTNMTGQSWVMTNMTIPDSEVARKCNLYSTKKFYGDGSSVHTSPENSLEKSEEVGKLCGRERRAGTM